MGSRAIDEQIFQILLGKKKCLYTRENIYFEVQKISQEAQKHFRRNNQTERTKKY
jgi:hypothetical protein